MAVKRLFNKVLLADRINNNSYGIFCVQDYIVNIDRFLAQLAMPMLKNRAKYTVKTVNVLKVGSIGL